MPSVMAIVSKKVFESDAKVGGRLVAVGDVWPTDRYVSKVAALRALEAGGALFLCTVRPPDERLWLVAVLEAPSFDGDKWTAAPNATPVRDVSAVTGALRFSTGAGVTAEPGKLGMSLQTPRVLTAEDEALLRGPGAKAAGAKAAKAEGAGKKAPRLGVDLEPAQAAALEQALARAKVAPAAAEKVVKGLVKELGQSAAALAVLDYAAQVLLGLGKGDQAGALFGSARALEKKLGKEAPERSPEDTLALYLAFARSGAIEERSLAALGTTIAKAKGGLATRYAELVGAWAAGGGVLGGPILDALDKVAKAAKADALALTAAVLRSALPAFGVQRGVDAEVWERLAPALAKVVREAPEYMDAVLDLFPEATGWGATLDACGGLEHLARADGARVAAWLARALTWEVELDEARLAWLARWVDELAPRVQAGASVAFGERTDPELIELALAAGLEVEAAHTLAFNDWSLRKWEERPASERGRLTKLCAHPVLGATMANTLGQALLRRPFCPKWAATPAFERAAQDALAVLAEVAEKATVAGLDMWLPALEEALTPEAFEHLPGLGEIISKFELSRALQRTLNLGVMDELHWPAQEEANARVGKDVDQYDTDGPFPYWVMWDGATHKVVVAGPEGVVLESVFRPPDGVRSMRSMRYVPGPDGAVGDVLFIYFRGSLKVGAWLSAPGVELPADYLQTWRVGVLPPSGGLSEGGPALTPGASELSALRFDQPQVFADGAHAWRVEGGRVCRFDPVSGAAEDGPGPAFLAGPGLVLEQCWLHPVPAACGGSPLGVVDGVAGWRVTRDANGRLRGEGVDGRSFAAEVVSPLEGDRRLDGIVRLPERDADLALVSVDGEWSLWTADGRMPIVPPKHANWYRYWYGAPQWLPREWWHLLVPVEPAASRALRDATLAQAEALLHAARGGADGDDSVQLAAGSATAVLLSGHRRDDAPEALPRVVAAIQAVLPEVTAPRLRVGLAHLAVIAAELEPRLAALKERGRARVVFAGGRKDDAFAALGALIGPGPGFCQRDFEDQVRAVDHALAEPPEGEGIHVVEVPESALPWPKGLAQTRALVWRLLAPGTPEPAREQLRAALELLASTSILAEPARHRVLHAVFSDWPAPGMRHDRGQRVITYNGGTNRYLMVTRHFDGQRKHYELELIERTHDGVFRDPPGCTQVSWQMPLEARGASADLLRRALTLLAERGPFGHDPAAARLVAERTGLLYPSAAMLLAAAWQPYEPSPEVRKALGLKVAEVELGRDELNVSWLEPYHVALPEDLALLYSPMIPGADGRSVAERLADAVVESVGVRTPLPVDVIERLRDELRGDRPYHLDVRVLERPEARAFFTRDVRWVVRPWTSFKSNQSWMRGWIPPGWPKHAGMPEGEVSPSVEAAFSGWAFRHFLAYLPWAQLELPRGHALRLGAAAIGRCLHERLANPELLLLAGAVDISLEEDPNALAAAFADLRGRFEGAPYEAGDGLPSARGIDRGDLVVTWPSDVDNGLFFAFRPARLASPEALARLAADLGFSDAFQPRHSGCFCGLRFGAHQVVDFTDLGSFVTWARPGFQRLVAALEVGGEGHDANPLVSASDAVARVQTRHGLDADAAALLLQLRALPEPGAERVRRYNGWDKRRYDAAAKALVSRGLAVEARYERTKRTLFTPGPIEHLPAPMAPMERAKVTLHGLEPDAKGQARAPFGVVLPLVPLGELFDAVASD